MAHDVLIAGALFPDVPSVQFPDSQQQWHSFTDVSDTTAAAADVASGKQFYDAQGTLTQGTASGGGGSAPKIGVLRPDAELWKSWTYDKLIVADEGVTKPSYSTSQKTLKSSETLETVALDLDNYDYAYGARAIAFPIYNGISTHNTGRFVYFFASSYYEFFEIPPDAAYDKDTSARYSTRYTSNFYSENKGILYYSASNTVTLRVSSTLNGCCMGMYAPSLSGTNLTVSSPSMWICGNSNQYNQTYWNATTDVRYQYIIELYRTPKNNQYFDGYSLKSLVMHAIDCAQSATGKLT